MDQFVKDHPFEGAAMRTQSSKPELRSFTFEELPPTVRLRIYRELLLRPKDYEAEYEDWYINEHAELSARTEGLMIEIVEGVYKMYPEIMRTSKKTHEEAATVLYGENWFSVHIPGSEHQGPMWQYLGWRSFVCLPHYSRFIAKMHLKVSVNGPDGPSQADPIFWCFYWITTNLENICKILSLNDLKVLKVDFYNGLGRRRGGSSRKGYYGERCLEPLKQCRAERFVINTYASPRYATELKTVIEGPKDAAFQAYRQAAEEELAIEYDESELSASEGTQEVEDELVIQYDESNVSTSEGMDES